MLNKKFSLDTQRYGQINEHPMHRKLLPTPYNKVHVCIILGEQVRCCVGTTWRSAGFALASLGINGK